MKLPRKTQQDIGEAIAQLDRGIAFLLDDKTRVIRIRQGTSYPVDTWHNGVGVEAHAIQPEIGCDLCFIYNARDRLKRLITPVIHEP